MVYRPVLKLCGIKRLETLDAAIEAGADMVGFIHFARSPRHVDIDTIAHLISRARGQVESVVVLVNPDNSLVAEIAALDPDWIQLHGPETPQRVKAIRAESGLNIMKAVGVCDAQDLARVADFAQIADRILLDAKAPKNAKLPGGQGVAFDWSLLATLDRDISYLLSGGLTPQNAARAIADIRPFGLDVSSGIESARGEKDHDKMRAFIANARQAAAQLER